MPQRPSIAIVGAGPAGLTAANILRRHGWDAAIFEADTSEAARDQGGTLDLHPDGGQLALAKAGLLDEFMAVARHEDQGVRVIDPATGSILFEDIPAAGIADRPEIDRLLLRRLLLDPLGEGVVQWNARLEVVEPHPAGGHALRFRDGTAGPFDLVIGADGAWSRVRRALTPIQPDYCGISFVELWIDAVDVRHPVLAQLVGHGLMFALADGAGITGQRNGGGTIRVYAALRTESATALAGITKAELLARFADWAPSLRALIEAAEGVAAVRPIVALPPDLNWEHRRGITLVGDAAHVMPPLGVGVNLAMLDAADLAEALVHGGDWDAAVRACEDAMIARARPLAHECAQGFEEMFAADAPRAVLEAMRAGSGA